MLLKSTIFLAFISIVIAQSTCPARVKQMVSSMSLIEKAGQMTQITIDYLMTNDQLDP